MTHLKRFIYLAICLFLLQTAVRAQETETFTHTIKQGETVYSIARIYQVTPESILQLNPAANAGIRAGGILLIPQQTPQANGQNRFHTIQIGETLYKLTKLYAVSADDICKVNPGLTAENFKAGMVIRIPETTLQPVNEEVKNNPVASTAQHPQGLANSGCMEMHKVKRKETLYSIARDYNITEEEIVNANPEMKHPDYKLRKGTFICIPYPVVRTEKPVIVKEETIPTNEELMNKTANADPQKKIRMGVILPLKGTTPENEKMIEFYRGVLLAVDDIKKSGISVDIYTYDSGKTIADIKNLTNRPQLTSLDFIIGPLYADQITPLGKFCQKNGIRMVVPFSSSSDNLYQNPYYYAVNAPKAYVYPEAAKITSAIFGQSNVIVMEPQPSDREAAGFIQATKKCLLQQGNTMKTLKVEDSEERWCQTLTLDKDNVIIPGSSGIKLLNQMFPKLTEFANLHPEYKFKIVGYPEWQTYTSSHLENFYRFDTYVFSSFFRNPLNGHSEQFESTYQKAFHTPTIISWPRFGMLGYDTAFFFLKGISTYGKAFEQNLSHIEVTPYQHQFDFQRLSNWSGFINSDMEFIHYSPSHSIELIRLKK